MISFSIGLVSYGQDNKVQDEKTKVKKTSTVPQKVHNTFSKNKKYKGYKSKRKHNGVTRKRKVNVKTGEVKTKVDD